jgi:hypothetical protein
VFNIGGSRSRSSSFGFSQSSSDAQSQSADSIAFEDIFANLYGNAAGAAGRAAAMAPQLNTQAASLFSGGVGFLDSLGGPSPLDERLAAEGTADEQIAALGEDLGLFLNEELLPSIASRGVATGTLGGDRQGVAQGRAVESMLREFARGSTSIRTADVNRRDALATSAAQQRLQAAGIGLDSLPGMYDLAQAGILGELAPWQALAAVLGGPTVLGSSSAFETSRGYSEDRSESKSKSFSLGFGS